MFSHARRLALPLIAILVAIASPALAQPFAEVAARLDDYPTLSAIRLEASAQRDRARAAGALPDPVLSAGVNNLPLVDPGFDRFLPTNKALGASQQIPDALTRRARTAQGLAEASATEVRLAAERTRLRAELIALLAERTALVERGDVLARQDATYAELAEAIEAELAGGQAVAFRLGAVDAERAGVAQRRALLTGQSARVEAQLAELVGLVPQGTQAPDVPILAWSGAAQAFYDVALAARGIDRAEAGVDLARGAYRPDWSVGLTYQQREASADGATVPFPGDDWVSAQVTLTVPLYASRSQAPRLRAARSEKAAAEARLQAAARMTRARYEGLIAEARAAEESVTALEQQAEALADRIAAQRRAYEAGYGDYSAVLDGEIARLGLEAEVATERARRTAAAARANALLAIDEETVR
ncbi:TolC family protein [Parvularcula dongshanensis]|uniref:Outer membrane protein TolC n=1 Tax=Parvularcula dongshanensis TaxID=1173995 RepID=A0A840I5L9_9PROT|nr:TolC family protein [Parvularcula dongshanensis]MBB4660246.1 outer membrane protein TolC [Parvularcula dongshanensis]